MQSTKLPTGGDLNAMTAQLLAQEEAIKNEAAAELGTPKQSVIPKNAVMVNADMLPSKGREYKCPMYVSPLEPIDLKNLNTMKPENAQARINGVLFNRVHGVPYKDILQGDKLWLLFYIRSVTYDDFPIFIKYKCKDCGKTGVYKATIKKLNVAYLADDFNKTLELPHSKDVLTLRLPTIRSEDRANSVKNNQQIKIPLDPDMIDLTVYLEEINGERVNTLDAYNYLKKLDAYDFSVYTNYLLENNFGILPNIKIPCDCGNTVVEEIGFTPDFFLPNFSKYKDL